MSLKYLILGFFVKIITGFDDTITHIPVLASVTRTRIGKIAFSIGILLAIIMAIIVSAFFAAFIRSFVYYRYISAALLFILAAAIHFDILVHKERTKAENFVVGCKKFHIRCIKLIGIGFIASIATVLDDIIAYSPLFLDTLIRPYAIIGILAATILEIMAVIYFAEKISKIKYKDEIASIGIITLGILILIGII
ncbi:hypothetical protein KY343_04720 [Candidatus Woesearchaeota archaeon]|nr:hypothetical protein [Candidatus Woesearchaeota archaeon]